MSQPDPDLLPRRFGRYELRALLGRGGMGEVYRAYDTVRRREVAVKLLSGALATDSTFQTRFERESQVAAQLADPHIIPIHDFGSIEGRLFLDMRLVEGDDLAAHLKRRGRLPLHEALDIVDQVASALDAAHQRGLVHRDVKPSNVLLTGVPGGRPFAYLVDFGIARPIGTDGSAVTTSSSAFGTAAYLAPERIRGEPGDPRADVYALGCVLFELVTGRRPWDGDIYAVLTGHVTQPVPSIVPEVPGCPPELDAVVRTAMAKRPDDRYPSAGAFARAATDAARAATTGPAYGGPPVPVTHPGPSSRPMAAPPTVARPPSPGIGDPYSAPWTAPPPPPPSPPRRGRGLRVALAVGAVLALALAVLLVVVLPDDGSPSAGPSRSGLTSGRPSPGSSGLVTGSGTSVSWAHFASFSALLGTRDGDTASSFQGATCRLGPRTSDDPAGLIEAVRCAKPQGTNTFFVGRFGTAEQVTAYLRDELRTDGYTAQAWGQNGVARGLTLVTPPPRTLDDPVSIDTVTCALPTYVVRFNASDAKVTADTLRSDVWGAATFPDLVPPGCTGDFTRTSGATGSAATPAKSQVTLDPGQVDTLLSRFVGTGDRTTSFLPGGSETMIIAGEPSGELGRLEFWTADAQGLSYSGYDNFPYVPGTGLDTYTLSGSALQPLKGMQHSTFTFGGILTKGRLGTLVYTRSADGDWGPVGLVGATGSVLRTGAPTSTIFRTVSLAGGVLTTQRCSRSLPVAACETTENRVGVQWAWSGTEWRAEKRFGRRS
ncbi:serine/threonine-protein kinase [Jatrophihabitans fulvus]